MKILGYIIAIIGIAVLATGSINEIKTFVTTSLKINLEQIGDINLIIAGVVLAVVGIFLVVKSPKGRKTVELPIYHGKNVVGYRRTR